MNNKKFKIILIILICIIVIGISIYYTLQYIQNKKQNTITEYTPQQEITDEQLRKTIVSLYFKDQDNTNLVPEARLIDAKLLITEPYKKLMELLIEGPKNQALSGTIPTGTRLNNITLTKGELIVDLSSEFIKNHLGTEEEKEATIYSIVKTMTELNEINQVKILIDGKENEQFENANINFNEPFTRKEILIHD